MEWPKRARTADWENGVLTLDGEKKFEIPELTLALMERLAGYTLVGFHVKGYPVTDELLAPFAEHKSMVNFGVEDGALTDACFPVFFAMPKLRYLLLDGNAAIHGSGLSALQSCKLDLLTLNRTGLDNAGLLQAASIPKLSHIQIDHTAVTYEGLLAIAGNNPFYEEMLRALWGYMGDKFNIPVANLTKENVREELHKRGVSVEESQRFTSIITKCDEAQYSPAASAQMSEVYAEGVDIISRIEAVIKR